MLLHDRIGRRLRLRDLNILLAVVKERSMSRAATVLAISQPAVSKSIADMEYMLGAPLLDRTPQGIEPTSYGRALIKRSVAVFDELRQSVKDIESLLDPTVGELRIGCTPPLAAGMVAAVIGDLSDRYPRISFHVVEGDVIAMQRELHDRNIDVAIGPVQEPITDENLTLEILFDDRLVVVAGADNKWLRRKKIKLSELLHEPWIFPHVGTLASSSITAAFRASGVDAPKAMVSSNSSRLNNNLLASGRFLSVVPESMMKLGAKHLPFKVLPIDIPNTSRQVVLFTLRNRTLSPVTRLFIDCVREVAKPLARRKIAAAENRSR